MRARRAVLPLLGNRWGAPSEIRYVHADDLATIAAPARPTVQPALTRRPLHVADDLDAKLSRLDDVFVYSGPSERGRPLVFTIPPDIHAEIEAIDDAENGDAISTRRETGGFLLARPSDPTTVVRAVAAYDQAERFTVRIDASLAVDAPAHLAVVGSWHTHPLELVALTVAQRRIVGEPSGADLTHWHSQMIAAELPAGQAWLCVIASNHPLGGLRLHGYGMRPRPQGGAKIEPVRLLDGSRDALELARLDGIVA